MSAGERYAVAVYRQEVTDALENKRIAGRSVALARWWLDQAEISLERGDLKDAQRRVQHVAERLEQVEGAVCP